MQRCGLAQPALPAPLCPAASCSRPPGEPASCTRTVDDGQRHGVHADAALAAGRGVQQGGLQVGHLPGQQRLLVRDLHGEGLAAAGGGSSGWVGGWRGLSEAGGAGKAARAGAGRGGQQPHLVRIAGGQRQQVCGADEKVAQEGGDAQALGAADAHDRLPRRLARQAAAAHRGRVGGRGGAGQAAGWGGKGFGFTRCTCATGGAPPCLLLLRCSTAGGIT